MSYKFSIVQNKNFVLAWNITNKFNILEMNNIIFNYKVKLKYY
jgi:hypothetical protein